MQIGDLVRWKSVIGIVLATRSSHTDPYRYSNNVYVQWSEHYLDACWMNNSALEVISESR